MMFDPLYTRQLGAAISQAGGREQQLTSELSSGSRVGVLSDDAVAVAGSVGLSGAVSGIDSFVTSSTGVQSGMQVADTALGQVVTQVNSALSAAVSAGNGTLSAANLSAIAAQVAGIRDSVVGLANTSYQGSYVFAGSQGGVKPFTVDSSTDPATVSYAGDGVVNTITTPDGQKIGVNVAGSSVFGVGATGLVGTLNQLVSDLNAAASGTGTTAAVQADSTALTAALGVVSVQRSVLDSGLSRLTGVTTYEQTQGTVLQARESALIASDPVTVATELSASETQYQALISVEAAITKTDLFSLMG